LIVHGADSAGHGLRAAANSRSAIAPRE